MIFCADFYAPPDLGLLMVLHGLCAVMGVVNIIVQWVHIIDNNASFLYTRLCNSFQAENSGEAAGKVVQLHSSMELLKTFQDVICADIFKKTSASCPDLYSVYENDQADAFHLIILRDGLVKGNGYGSSEILDAVSALTKINGMGHRCGVRFLIIDDSASFEKAINDKIKFTIMHARINNNQLNKSGAVG